MKLEVGTEYETRVKATVVEKADVVVAGGGTAGCVASIAAARNGVRVILIERQGFLGGMMTGGNAGLTKYVVHEKDPEEYRNVLAQLSVDPSSVQVVGGLPMEITRRLLENKIGIATEGTAGSYVFTSQADFKWLLLELMEEAGVMLMLHCLVVDVIKDGRRIQGVVVENKSGRQAVLGDVVVDATGDGDAAARAGVPFVLGVGPEDLAAEHGTPPGTMQEMGVMFRMGNVDMKKCFEYLKEHTDQFIPQRFAMMDLDYAYESFLKGDMMTIKITGIGHFFQIYNTPDPGVFTFCCPSCKGNGLSVRDLTKAEVTLAGEIHRRVKAMKESLPGFEDAYLLDCPEIGVRETRHFRGEYVLNIEDIINGKQFPDGIGKGCHPIDIQPIPESLKDKPLGPRWHFNIPYRSLVPLEIDNLLLAGRCISNTHEASGCTRPTVQCMVTGEAAGTAAALCAKQKIQPRNLPFDKLRNVLVKQGVLL